MRIFFENTFKSQGRAIDQNAFYWLKSR